VAGDHAHEIMIEAVEELIERFAPDPNEWDGDDAAETIYRDFLGWLPDMIRHAAATKLRAAWPGAPVWEKATGDKIDPWRRAGDLSWVRKEDGREVPWRAVPMDERDQHE